MERNQSNENYGRTFLQAWLSRFEEKWNSIEETCDGLDGPRRKLAEQRVRTRLGTLFMREFVPFADAVIHVFGRRRFEDVFDLPRRTGGDQHRYAWWLTGSDNTDVATRRIVLWTACARNPASYDQGPQYPAMLEEWATSVFLCAPQPEEPFIARTIHQWLDWVRQLISKLEMPARELRSPFVTSLSGFRQWQLQQQDGHAIFTRMITEPVLAPCARLVNMNWEFDLVPTDLSVAAVEAWFDALLKLPTDDPRSGGLFYWWEIWPAASVQDASEIVRDAYRLARTLADVNQWTDLPPEPTRLAVPFLAHDAICQLETVQGYLRSKVNKSKRWSSGQSRSKRTLVPASDARTVVRRRVDSTPSLSQDDLFTKTDAANWLGIDVKTIYNKFSPKNKAKKPTAVHAASGRCSGRFRFDELCKWLMSTFPKRAPMIPRSVNEARQQLATAKMSSTGSRAV